MDSNLQLDDPQLGVQYERGPTDAFLRNFKVLRKAAELNGFEDRLNTILAQYGIDQQMADLKPGEKPEPAVAAKLGRAMDVAQVELKRDIENARRGVQPFTQAIAYTFKGNDGRAVKFNLDPDQRAYRTLQDFETAISNVPNMEEIVGGFMPAFERIRSEMKKWGWDGKEASPQATLLAIKELCDTWAHG